MKAEYKTPKITVDELEKTDVLLVSVEAEPIDENAHKDAGSLISFALDFTNWW